MGIFSKKQSVKLEDFCRDFYEKNILNPVIAGVDAGEVYFDTVRKSIVEVDPNFSNITSKKLAEAMIPLHFELFALAWLHKFGEKLAIAQSVFTKNYLHEKKRDDIWEASEVYNQVIARSSTLGRTPEKAFDRVFLARVNTTRMNLFEQYHKEGFDDKCVARVLNRLFSEDAWKRNVTAGLLMFALCDRLGFDKEFEPNKEAQFRWVAVIRGLYDGAYQALENIKIES